MTISLSAMRRAVMGGLVLAGGSLTLTAADYDFEAEDLSYADIRIGYGTAPRNAQIAAHSRTTTTSQDSSFTWGSTGRLSVLVLPPPGHASNVGRGLWGFEIAASRGVYDGHELAERLDVREVQLLAHLGLGWVVTQRLSVEFTGFGGPNMAWQVGQERSGFGDGWQVGLRLGTAYTFANGLQLHAALLAIYDRATFTTERVGEEWTATLTDRGIAPAVGLGWRF